MLGGLTQREDHEKKLLWLRSARLALEASTAIAFYACTMDPRISESLNWLSWIATEKLLDHNDGQLAKWTQGRLNGTPSCSKSDATRKIKILQKDPKLISLKMLPVLLFSMDVIEKTRRLGTSIINAVNGKVENLQFLFPTNLLNLPNGDLQPGPDSLLILTSEQ
ncbi:hypothetical protein T06_14623 [Trichinella sp. T6]|nr:hypothetical protein T06_14623 [Trichinella sp. T6]